MGNAILFDDLLIVILEHDDFDKSNELFEVKDFLD